MKLTFDHIEDMAVNIHTFWFKPEKTVDYTAGQYTELHLVYPNPDDRGTKRWFTLSSSPTEELLSITTKFNPASSTFKQALLRLKPGTRLHAADPMGDFVLPKDPSIPLVFVAGGIGVTPFRSMIKWLTDKKEKRAIHMIYAANKLKEVAFRQLLESYGLKLDLVISQPTPDWKGLSGTLTPERILGLIGSIKDRLIYLSGPEPMIESLMDGLEKLGINKKQLVSDFFPGYTVI